MGALAPTGETTVFEIAFMLIGFVIAIAIAYFVLFFVGIVLCAIALAVSQVFETLGDILRMLRLTPRWLWRVATGKEAL